jgi:enterochelin esterase-like enzyme
MSLFARRLRLAAVLLAAAACHPSNQGGQAHAPPTPSDPATGGGEWKVVEYDAPSVGMRLKYGLLLPADYGKSTQRYPVIYLVHEYTGSYRTWPALVDAAWAARLGVILVMPDVGNTWCVNWPEAHDGHRQRWEDVITHDLVAQVDATLGTVPTPKGRAVGGISMGGWCGIFLATLHPDLFGSAIYHAGQNWALRVAKDLANGTGESRSDHEYYEAPPIDVPGFSSQEERSPKGLAFTSVAEAEAHDPWKIIPRLPTGQFPRFYVDCDLGEKDLSEARELRSLLMTRNVPFTYMEAPGNHNAAYFRRQIVHSLWATSSFLRAPQ